MTRPLLIAFLTLVMAAGCNTESAPEPERAAAPEATSSTGQLVSTPRPKPVVESCATRSEAEFGEAFVDPANLVAGPFVLIGAGDPTSAGVVEEHEGQKFPALVRAGHAVTVEVPESARGLVALGYGPLPQGRIHFDDGHPAVHFRACAPDGPSSSTSGPGEPVTFWSGVVLVSEPMCAPLDVYADGATTPHRIEIELGEAC